MISVPARSPISSNASELSRLPTPPQAALQHSRRLVDLIVAEIEQSGGRIPFDRYMDLALYAPGLGYYAAGARKFGEAGDFITAPEISPLFGRCVARQCEQVLDELQGGAILEVGAGSGRLAVDLLTELASRERLPDRYFILEVSPDLRERQRSLLSQSIPELVSRVKWIEGLPPPGFSGVVIANEVIDAMPVQRFRLDGGSILEQFVVRNKATPLALNWGSPSARLHAAVGDLLGSLCGRLDDYESELNLRGASWLTTLSDCLDKGLLLLIDYGYGRSEYYHHQRDRGTMMCHYRHRAHEDPLLYPGLQDITAHVDFTALATAAQLVGLDVCGYNTQTFFLLGCGLERLMAESDPSDVRSHVQLMQGVKRLTLPSEMGERFKALGLSRGLGQQPMAFSLQDLRGRL